MPAKLNTEANIELYDEFYERLIEMQRNLVSRAKL
jgi:hypothetical protein